MGNGFYPGGLALVVSANRSENLGQVVELLRRDDSLVISHAPYCPHSTGNANRAICWVVRGKFSVRSVLGGDVLPMEIAAIPEGWLMPLRGDEDPDAVRQTETPREAVGA